MNPSKAADLVTVVIATHQRREILRRTLRSVLAQEGVELEVVVVDDGSTDGTSEMLAGHGDERVRRERNEVALGACGARNVGIAAARGEWIAFLDDDDLWAPTKLAEQLQAIEQDGIARWSSAGTVTVDERIRPVVRQADLAERDVRRLLLSDNQVPGGCSGVLADRDLVVEVGLFDEQLWQPGDWDLWIRLALASPVAVVRRPLVAYVQHEGGMSRSTEGLRVDLERMRLKYVDAREELGVRWHDDYWGRFIAETEMRAGRRRPALASHLEVFRAHRHWSWLPLAAAGAVAPRATMAAVDRWEQARMGRPSEEELRWLRPYQTAEDRP